jgi:hypothetical protein
VVSPFYDTNSVEPGTEPGKEAVVTVGTLSTQDAPSKYADTGQGVWADYQAYSRFERDNHLYMMGMTSPSPFQGNSVAFVQLAAPTLLWILDWTAARRGSQPTVPDPTPSDPNWVLLDQWYRPVAPKVLDDGQTPVYRLEGTYVYGHRSPAANMIANMSFPRVPWLDDSIDRSIPASIFQKNLSDGQGGNNISLGGGGGEGGGGIIGPIGPGGAPVPPNLIRKTSGS